MRTTIDPDEEFPRTAKAISNTRGAALSRVNCNLAWRGLRPEQGHEQDNAKPRNGFPLLPARAGAQAVTPEHVAELMNACDEACDAGKPGRCVDLACL